MAMARKVWSCSACAVALILAVLDPASAAEFKRRDGVHRLEKAQVTASPDLAKRAVAACPENHQLCPESAGGLCCAKGYSCATDSCYATTSSVQTCQGMPNFYACAPDKGGGCCAVGSICDREQGCVLPSGVTTSHDCSANYYLCPSSVGYGCCRNGMGCGQTQCFFTAVSTATSAMIITTMSDNSAVTLTSTVTTVITPSTPETTGSLATEAGLTSKYYPNAIPKVQPITSDTDGNSGGLSKGAIGGIVGGAVGFLIIILAAAIIIIRHLNKVVKAVDARKDSSSGSKSRPPMRQYKPTDSEIDALSVDPLMMTPRPSHRRNDSDSSTPYGWQSPEVGTGDRGTPVSFNGYQAVATSGSDGQSGADSGGDRSYFDPMPPRAYRISHQSSARRSSESHVAGSRHRSNASDAGSELASGQATPQELDAASTVVLELPATPTEASSPDARRRSGGSGSISRPPLTHQRRKSDGQASHGRKDSGPGNGSQLDVVNERPEISTQPSEIHGHYGPSDKMVGQTMAGYP